MDNGPTEKRKTESYLWMNKFIFYFGIGLEMGGGVGNNGNRDGVLGSGVKF